MAQRREQALHAAAIALLDDVVERLAPLALFERLELGVVLGCDIPHLIESSRHDGDPVQSVVSRRTGHNLPVVRRAGLQSFYCSPVARSRRLNRDRALHNCEAVMKLTHLRAAVLHPSSSSSALPPPGCCASAGDHLVKDQSTRRMRRRPSRELRTMTARFAPADIGADLTALPESERRALAKLVEAARLMDSLFLRQVWAGNDAMLQDLAHAAVTQVARRPPMRDRPRPTRGCTIS